MEAKVLVIGGNHHNTLGVIRALGRKNILTDIIIVTAEKKPFVSKSKYVNKSFILSTDEDIVPCLLNNYWNFKEKPVVIACADSVASVLDMNRSTLEQFFYLPGSSRQGRITELMDKNVMGKYAYDSGLNIPESICIEGGNINLKNILDIKLPCIIKPLLSKDGTKSDINICQNIEDLKITLNKQGRYQVQAFISKLFEYQLIGCSMGGVKYA